MLSWYPSRRAWIPFVAALLSACANGDPGAQAVESPLSSDQQLVFDESVEHLAIVQRATTIGESIFGLTTTLDHEGSREHNAMLLAQSAAARVRCGTVSPVSDAGVSVSFAPKACLLADGTTVSDGTAKVMLTPSLGSDRIRIVLSFHRLVVEERELTGSIALDPIHLPSTFAVRTEAGLLESAGKRIAIGIVAGIDSVSSKIDGDARSEVDGALVRTRFSHLAWMMGCHPFIGSLQTTRGSTPPDVELSMAFGQTTAASGAVVVDTPLPGGQSKRTEKTLPGPARTHRCPR